MTTTLENQILNQLNKEAFDNDELETLSRTTIKIDKVIGQLVFFTQLLKSKITGNINEVGTFHCDTTTTGKVKTRSIRIHYKYAN